MMAKISSNAFNVASTPVKTNRFTVWSENVYQFLKVNNMKRKDEAPTVNDIYKGVDRCASEACLTPLLVREWRDLLGLQNKKVSVNTEE